MIQAPKGLELKVFEKPECLKGEEGLSSYVTMAAKANLNYAAKAMYPGASNEKTAGILNDIFAQAYNDPNLYDAGESFRAEGLYWNGSEFVRL